MSPPPPPLRVLHVAHGWPPAGTGGTERYAAAVARAQAEAGATTEAFAPGAPGWVPPAPARGFRATWAHPGVEATFRAHVARLRPDVVHLHHLSGLSVGLAALARPAVVVATVHDHWYTCARGQRVTAAGEACAGPEPGRCARCLAPVLWGPIPGARHLPPRVGPVRARVEAVRALLAELDLVWAPSPHIAAGLGRAAEPIDLPLLDIPRARVPVDVGPVRFAFVGALIPTKGVDLAVRAFAALPAGAGTLDVYGPVVPWDGSTRWAGRLPRPPGVTWQGAVDRVPWERIDVLLFPSTWDENHPLVLVEAGAAGARIVAADVPGARHVAPQARFFAPRSLPGLRAAMATEVSLGHLPGAVRAAPSLEAHAATLLERYTQLVEARRARHP